MHFKCISKCQKIWDNVFGCTTGYSMFVHKVSRQKIFFVAWVKRQIKCLMKTHFGAPEVFFFTHVTKMFFCKNLCVNIECPDIHPKFLFEWELSRFPHSMGIE